MINLSTFIFSFCTAKLSQLSGFESPDVQASITSSTPTQRAKSRASDTQTPYGDRDDNPTPISQGPAGRIKSALSTISSTSSHFLEPPPLDLRPEQRLSLRGSEEAMVDQRKRDREILNRISGRKNSKKVVHLTLICNLKAFWYIWHITWSLAIY